eukprot:gene59653-81630_t
MPSRRQLLLAAAAASVAGPAFAQIDGPEKQLGRLLDAVFAEALEDSPELVTSLGLDKGAHADAKSKLIDASFAGVERRKARNADQLRRLKAIDRRPLAGMAAKLVDR